MRVIGTFELARAQAAKWRRLELQELWAQRYPDLFDPEDRRLAIGPQARRGYHLVEWLGAITLHNLTGFHSLVGKYQYQNHPRKRVVLRELGLSEILARRPEFRRTQGPDLLMFSEDRSYFFFCEVKGPGDSFKPLQKKYFRYLEEATRRPIGLLRYKWANDTANSARRSAVALPSAPLADTRNTAP